MLFLLLATITSVLASDICDPNKNNIYFYGMNPDCQSAGRCDLTDANPPVPFCLCCDRYDTNLQTSFLYARKGDANSGPGCYGNVDWVYGVYAGSTCGSFTTYYGAMIKYLIFMKNQKSASKPNGWEIRATGSWPSAAGTDPNTGNPYLKGTIGNVDVECELLRPSSKYYKPNIVPPMENSITALLNDAANQFHEDGEDDPLNYQGIFIDYMPPKETTGEQSQKCRACGTNPIAANDNARCIIGDTEKTAQGYLLLTMITDYNSFYAPAGSTDSNGNDISYPNTCKSVETDEDFNESLVMPLNYAESRDNCKVKTDNGKDADWHFKSASAGTNNGNTHLKFVKEWVYLPWAPSADPPTYGTGWNRDETEIQAIYLESFFSEVTFSGELRTPTMAPTRSPTMSPSDPPVGDPDCFTLGYTHTPEDFVFKGVAEPNCRQGLSVDWPGGQGCDSPYVTCLPQENNPEVGWKLGIDGQTKYFAKDHKYTIDQCKMECAYDQRCLGFEFTGKDGGDTGDCYLIDDIPVVVNNPVAGVTEGAITTPGADLTPGALGGTICYALKDDYCNPYFTEDQLEEVMLQCYCPDNRKGFYTKKVHRTVYATRYCGTEDEATKPVTKRIREAQANRMFHLCENWCLFNTQTPRAESWYHDPWNQCWREQYAGLGTHRSYCFRVIRDPMTIEQYFIDTRSDKMCKVDSDGNPANGDPPTMRPVSFAEQPTWIMAMERESCDSACGKQEKYCDGNYLYEMHEENDDFMGGTNVWNADPGDAVKNMFKLALGYDCATVVSPDVTLGMEGTKGWALPAMHMNTRTCITRSKGNTAANTPCNLAIGEGYRRLCACREEAPTAPVGPPSAPPAGPPTPA